MKKIKTWWLLMTAGLTLLVIGALSLFNPGVAYHLLCRYCGYVLLLNGLLLVLVEAIPSTYEREKKWLMAESVMDFSFAVILLVSPVFTDTAFPYIIGYWMLSLGIIKIAAALSLVRYVRGWMFVFFTGIVATIFSLMIVSLPLENLERSSIFFGIFGLAMGVLTVYDAFRFRRMENTLNLLF